MRSVEIPKHLKIFDTNEDLIKSFEETLEEYGRKLVIIIGKRAYDLIVKDLVRSSGQKICHLEVIDNNFYVTVQKIDSSLFSKEPDCVVAVGGGKVIDVGKIIAHRWRLPFISVPTQIAHDGIASPVAVIDEENGCKRSLGATMPVAVLTSIELVRNAPEITIKAGIGDLLSNLSAVFDWQMAHAKAGEKFDDYAAIMSKTAAFSVLNELENIFMKINEPFQGIKDENFLRLLIECLILSGIAMSIAGSSRPASGSEHLFSHAIDELYGGLTLHGVQVALGTVISLVLQEQWELYQRITYLYRRVGLPVEPSELELGYHDLRAVFEIAPKMRPGRYTVLDEIKDPLEKFLNLKKEHEFV